MIACIPPRRVDHPVESIIPQSRPFRRVDHGKSGEVYKLLFPSPRDVGTVPEGYPVCHNHLSMLLSG